jgi:hypothetical protein
MSMSIRDADLFWLINDKYEVNKTTGGVVDYSTKLFSTIPPSIYGIRDRLMECNRLIINRK